MRTSELFGANNEDFLKSMVYPQGKGERVEAVRIFSDKMGVNFCADGHYGRHLCVFMIVIITQFYVHLCLFV